MQPYCHPESERQRPKDPSPEGARILRCAQDDIGGRRSGRSESLCPDDSAATGGTHVPNKLRVAIVMPSDATDEQMTLARQLGCDEVILATPTRLPGAERWEYDDLARLREWVESFGLQICALQNVPHEHWQKVRLGRPGREAQLENYLQ